MPGDPNTPFIYMCRYITLVARGESSTVIYLGGANGVNRPSLACSCEFPRSRDVDHRKHPFVYVTPQQRRGLNDDESTRIYIYMLPSDSTFRSEESPSVVTVQNVWVAVGHPAPGAVCVPQTLCIHPGGVFPLKLGDVGLRLKTVRLLTREEE